MRFAHGQMIRCVRANAISNSDNDDVDRQSAIIRLIFPVDLLFNQSATSDMQSHLTNRIFRSFCIGILVRLPKQLFMAQQMRSAELLILIYAQAHVRPRSS